MSAAATSLLWCPCADKNKEREGQATERFKAISEAYEVLSNPEKRRLYDRKHICINLKMSHMHACASLLLVNFSKWPGEVHIL